MKIWDILSMGLRNLLRRKTRTFLTIIGVVVGATAIVIMLSLGIGMDEQLNRTIESIGDLTIINVRSWVWRPPAEAGGQYESSQNTITDALVERIKTWDGVVAVTPYMTNIYPIEISAGKRNKIDYADVVGIDASFIPYLKLNVSQGYLPQPGDTNFVLFGRNRIYMFYNPLRPPRDWNSIYNPDFDVPPRVDVLKEKITIQGKSWNQQYNPETDTYETVGKFKKYVIANEKIGILEVKENNWGYDENGYYIFIDYNMAKEIQKEIEKANKTKASESMIGKYEEIKIKVKDMNTSEEIQRRLKEEEGITTEYSLSEERDALRESQRATQMLLGGIGAISLFVAAIGIANTMFMSIYERTKEIGVMKVLGCPLPGIQSMFLFEASIIGFSGGIFGSGLSVAASVAMNKVDFIRTAISNMSGTGGSGYYYMGNAAEQGDISVIPLWLILMAILFSTMVGLVSGYLPARRATKISALEAIRNE